jgi:sterol desaturase/sphingolipid hydroxylase (fatty acid hydroxylase superfamily)
MYTHTYLDHSGYEFPWCPLQLVPFSGYVRAHNYHHTANVCNFGLYWRFWDWIMDTERQWIDSEKKRTAELRFNERNSNKTVKEAPAAVIDSTNGQHKD